MITVTFACGHSQQVNENVTEAPMCRCGERRVSRVKAPAPRFVHAEAVAVAIKE